MYLKHNKIQRIQYNIKSNYNSTTCIRAKGAEVIQQRYVHKVKKKKNNTTGIHHFNEKKIITKVPSSERLSVAYCMKCNNLYLNLHHPVS